MDTALKVGVLGANGQVGAELCLLLAHDSGLQVIPICRTRSGSAFLRWKGIACRHGHAATAADAARLMGDCDVIVNSALASGTPAEIRRTEDLLIRNSFRYSRPRASIIYLSTQTVYGDPTPGRSRWMSAYGRAKLLSERTVRAYARRHSKAGYIFRLGHVGGTLQNISMTIRENIRSGRLQLPEEHRPSNMVYTVSIVDAIQRVIAGSVTVGTYDLMNVPQWSWQQVHEYEAQRLGMSPKISYVPPPPSPGLIRLQAQSLIRALLRLTTSRFAHEHGNQLIAFLPATLNRRAQAWWNLRRARAQIAALATFPAIDPHFYFVENGKRFVPGLAPTGELLESEPFGRVDRPSGEAWPDDLADALPSGATPSVASLLPEIGRA